MADLYPGYDVLAKRNGLSWNETTRRAIAARLAVVREPRFFSAAQWQTLQRLCERILPQPVDRPPIPLAAYIDEKMLSSGADGTRIAPMPYDGDCWKIGLDATDIEAKAAFGAAFHELPDRDTDALLHRMQNGELHDPAWGDVPPKQFFSKRVLQDVAGAYYAHPTAWSEIGFGGPASPRGYVRMEANHRDPWEAAEAKPGGEDQARAANHRVR